MNLKQAKSLNHGDRVHYTGRQDCSRTIGPRGGETIKITECRVSGEPKTWKRSPERVKVPIKYGMYENAYITEHDLGDWHLESECPIAPRPISGIANPDVMDPLIEDGGTFSA